MSGWIKLHRKITEHWLWEENRPLTKLEAWLDILLEANHQDKKVMLGDQLIMVKRGDSINSLDTWSKRWKWNKSKVRRFLKMLESDSMIVLKPNQKTTHLTICNYESYQGERNANETQMKRKRNASETHLTPNKNEIKNEIKNVHNNEEEEENPTPTPIRSIKRIVLDYKENERLVNAVLNSRENLFFSQQDLFDKLDDFVEHLTTIDQTAKKEHDFKSHFLNWTRAQKRKAPAKEIDYDKLFNDED